jgi:ubiquinone/menaquinone biosynthesis C-methylase UbiE
MSAFASDSSDSGVHSMPMSEFETREQERRRARIERLDRIAERRMLMADRHQYYTRQVHRLVAGLVNPGSRVLEVGCGLGDLLAALKAEGAVGLDISPRRSNFTSRTLIATRCQQAHSTRSS